MPGSSQDLSNGNTQDYHSTSNPQPLTFPAQENVNQPNQVSLNINGKTNKYSISYRST